MDYDRAVLKYSEMFPGTRVVSSCTIRRAFLRLSTTGSFHSGTQSRSHPITASGSKQTDKVLKEVGDDPHVSLRTLAKRVQTSKSSVLRILHKHKLHPYHVSLHQHFQPGDNEKRLDFCNWILCQTEESRNFVNRVIWTDEAHFCHSAQVNLHNAHYRSQTSPHWLQDYKHQYEWGFNVWAGIYNGAIIGPIFFTGSLNASRYCSEILDAVFSFVDDLPLAERTRVWFQHDGAPPHSARRALQLLRQMFREKCVGRFGPVSWPARSPDLTPMDFYLWGRIKDEVYKSEPRSPADLQGKITAFCSSLSRSEIKRAAKDTIRRAQLCIAVDGEHFEHF